MSNPPDVVTGEDGTATVRVTYPDSLTTWRATARVASNGSEFGTAASSTRTVPFSRVLYVEQDDFREEAPRKWFRLAPGREVRLKHGYYASVSEIDHHIGRVDTGRRPVPEKKKAKKRIPQTPLERIDLSQLKLVGIIMASSGNRALVEESSGKGYVIKKGTYIGINSGKVVKIKKEKVVVEEEFEDVFGKTKLHQREIKLPKPPGEF